MTGSDFGQQFVGRQQHSFNLDNLFGWQGDIKILGDDVGIDPDIRPADTGSL